MTTLLPSRMSIVFPALVVGTLAMATLPALALEVAGSDGRDLVLKDQQAFENMDLRVEGSLVVSTGSSVTLSGVVLHVGDRIVIEPGGSLALGPAAGQPTVILPIDASQGFWIEVKGHLSSQGAPRTEITGLRGSGLNSVISGIGGLRVNGTADLADIDVRNGTAGLIVDARGSLSMRDASYAGLGIMGLASMGQARLERVEAFDNIIAATGKGSACGITIIEGDFHDNGANLQLNGCTSEVRSTVLAGGDNSVVVNGKADVVLAQTQVLGYTGVGLRGDGGTSLRLQDVTLRGAEGASMGISLKPNHDVTLEGVIVEGHEDDGINIQVSTVKLAGVAVRGNGGGGIQLVQSPWPNIVGPLDFGNGTTANGRGGFRSTAVVTTVLVDGQGHPMFGYSIEAFDGQGNVLFKGSPDTRTGSLAMVVDVARTAAGGEPESAGPFSYRLEHAELGLELEGPFDPDEGYLQIQSGESAGGTPAASWKVTAVLAAAGVALLAFAVFTSKGWRRRREHD